MSPRPYTLGQREVAANETRSRILAAARTLLVAAEGPGAFTVEAVAREAGVARMTVYYQFESKTGLLEALFDQLAGSSLVERIVQAFKQPEPLDALAGFVQAFATFAASDRVLIRRLRGLAVADPEIERSMRGREERRRDSAREIVGRLVRKYGRPEVDQVAEAIDLLFTMTSFETFDSLIGTERRPEAAAALVERSLRASFALLPAVTSL